MPRTGLLLAAVRKTRVASLVDGRGERAELCQPRIRRGAGQVQGGCSSDGEEKEGSGGDREVGGGDRGNGWMGCVKGSTKHHGQHGIGNVVFWLAES